MSLRVSAILIVFFCSLVGNCSSFNTVMARSEIFGSITLFVQNVDLSRNFYRALGFWVWDDSTFDKYDAAGVYGATDLPLTADAKTSRIIRMGGKNDIGTSIALLSYNKPPLASARGNIMGVGTGDILLQINTDDISSVYDKLQRIGTRFHARPARHEVFNKNGSLNFSGYRLLVYDPDGHLVEVFELAD